MKKLASLLLLLAMTMTLVPSAIAEEVALPLTTEPVTITIAVARHSSDAVEDFNTKYAIAEAEKATGVHIEWIPVTEGNDEQVATLLAGDLPDVFLGLLTDTLVSQNTSQSRLAPVRHRNRTKRQYILSV